MTALDDLPREIRRLLDRLPNHEGGQLDLMLIRQVEDSRHPLIDAIMEEGVGRQVRQPLLDVGDDSARAGDRLTACLEHE
jgi:hypothetical protein